jgi:hypothetical protein
MRIVVHIDCGWLAHPGLASVLESSDELLLLLRIHAEDGQPGRSEHGALYGDVVELLVTVGVVRRGLDLLGFDVQCIAEILQKSTHGRRAHRMADSFQSIPQAAQTAAHPDLTRHRVAGCFRFNQLPDCGDDAQVFFLVGGRPAPGWRTRSTGRSTREAANSTRPRRMVFSSTPVISNRRRSAPCPSRSDSTARYQRRCCSSNRLNSKFICRCYSRLGCASPRLHGPHSHSWMTSARIPHHPPRPQHARTLRQQHT